MPGRTQSRNDNESFNAPTWHFASKHRHNGSIVVESRAHLAAGIFNEGYITIFESNVNDGNYH